MKSISSNADPENFFPFRIFAFFAARRAPPGQAIDVPAGCSAPAGIPDVLPSSGRRVGKICRSPVKRPEARRYAGFADDFRRAAFGEAMPVEKGQSPRGLAGRSSNFSDVLRAAFSRLDRCKARGMALASCVFQTVAGALPEQNPAPSICCIAPEDLRKKRAGWEFLDLVSQQP
jgi:hypothetical protein